MPACCEGTIICGVDAEIEIIECGSDHTSNGREGGQGRHGSLSLFTVYCRKYRKYKHPSSLEPLITAC